jgi:hypothetical protein
MTERPGFLEPGPRAALLGRIHALTLDDLQALDAAVRSLAAGNAHRHVDKGVLFAWWDGPRLQRNEDDELQDLFAAVLGALAGGLTGLDVERFGARFARKPPGLAAFAQALFPPRESRRLQEASIGLIEDAVAPWDPRLAIIATWNMACAAAIGDHLPTTMVATLEAPWRLALGEPPV